MPPALRRHVVEIARAAHEGHRVPRHGRVLRGVEAHGAVERVVVLDVEFEFQAGEVRSRQVLQAQVVEVVVGVVEAEDGEILGGLEDAGDGDTRGCGVVQRGRRGAAGEALDMHVPARVEDPEGFCSHRNAHALGKCGDFWTGCSGQTAEMAADYRRLTAMCS